MRWAAWNIVGAFIRVLRSPVAGFSRPSRMMLSTDWVIDRLPADAIAMMRSPGSVKVCSLRNTEMLSRPALVRVSAIITNPSWTSMPQQYVMACACSLALDDFAYNDGGRPAAMEDTRSALGLP